ncbi:hypothetical protein O1611_g1709 [Lasiodiplodia mahajangana]|uniref:Uncharacterized protein n=1 Tax=Lasiodiplodia mahajangana TaxID=1108764 RepID=A0ACC2JXA6_9PEZI|nr:hypothetical protein O1611_g1709 [Lasiodiplodia mahajangana]
MAQPDNQRSWAPVDDWLNGVDDCGNQPHGPSSSPTDQMDWLENYAGITCGAIKNDEADGFPKPLRDFLDPIKKGTLYYEGLFFASQRQEIRDYALATPRHREIFESFHMMDALFMKPADNMSDPVGLREYEQRLDPEFVGFILDQECECDSNSHPDESWNMMVNCPLMRRVVMGASRYLNTSDSDNPSVTVVPCTTARLIANFKIHGALGYRMDFAIAIEPSRAAAKRIDAKRKSMPEISINHVDYRPLLKRPIAIPVRTAGDFIKAKVRLMVWFAAQWKKIDSMTDRPPGVLPGIIIWRNQWYLVASTRTDDGRTVRHFCILI